MVGFITLDPTATVKEIEEDFGYYYGQMDALNQRCGFGRALIKQGNVKGQIQEGNWKNNLLSGYSRVIFANGDCFEGHFKDGRQHGFGKKTYVDGRIKTGHWTNGTFSH